MTEFRKDGVKMSCLKDIQERKRTQGDVLRSMSDEELAGFLVSIEKDTKNYCTWDSVPCCLLWLTSEVKE